MHSRRAIPALLTALLLAAPSLAAGPTTAPTKPHARRGPTDRPQQKVDAKGQPDHYFMDHHRQFLARDQAGPIGVLFLGDSITDFWNHDVYQAHYGPMDPADFGVSGDRTEHVLWRIDHGELDGTHPKVVVLMIGTNNIDDTAPHIEAGVKAVVKAIHAKLPATKLLLLAVFPRGADPADRGTAAMRAKIDQVNAGLAKLDDGKRTRYLDLGPKFLQPDGTLPKSTFPDSLHPNKAGYEIWADAMQPLLDEMMR